MKYSFLTLIFFFFGVTLFATDTQIIVRAKAKDAKFVGSSLGGAYVIIKNKLTGEILAQGKTEGSTGNTDLIMKQAKERYTQLADDNTAKFMATIDIDDPTFITVEVSSPLNDKQAQVQASTELWLIPGKHILGDGVVVEIPGFIVDILAPRTHQYISLEEVKGKPFSVQANIVMMCGCTISKNGLWDSEKMEVAGLVKLDGKSYTEVPLENVGTNLFEGSLEIEKAGQYEVTIYAFDERTGNTGVDKVNFVIYE